MSKRLVKLHKRKVARAKDRVKLSEPDVRTPEEIRAAREASRPAGGWQSGASANFSARSAQGHAGGSAHSPAKADAP
jgi:hypothetical protein